MLILAVHLQGRLDLPTKLDQPIGPNVEIYVRLERNKNEVIINSALENTKLYLDIVGVEIVVHRLVIQKDIHLAIERRLNSGEKLTYYFNRIELNNYIIPGNTSSFAVESLFRANNIPPLIYIWFQEQKRFLGDFKLSPHKVHLLFILT